MDQAALLQHLEGLFGHLASHCKTIKFLDLLAHRAMHHGQLVRPLFISQRLTSIGFSW